MRLSWILAGVLALGATPQIGVNALISQLESPDSQAVADASKMLTERGLEVVPAVLKALHDNQSCQVQFLLTGVLRELQPDSAVPNATLLGIAQSKCKMKQPGQEAMFRRRAAFFLAGRADGVAAMAGLLQGGDSATRRAAVLGFVDVLMGLSTGTPKIDMTPAWVDAMKPALSALARSVRDSDDYVKCGAYDALIDAGKAPSDDLQQHATHLLESVPKPKCPVK